MKQLLIFIVFFIVGFSAGRYVKSQRTDLEIYTKDNIYYIKHLTVTNEVDAGKKEFKNKEQLKEYISNLTAKSVQ